MKLSKLLVALEDPSTRLRLADQADVEISGIVADSRQVQPGNLFVAIPGVERDGHSFIPDAIHRGAAVVVGQQPSLALFGEQAPLPYIAVPNARSALAWLCAAWYDYPARKMRIIGVTGTEGKTTTVLLVGSILQAAGHRYGLISTVSALIGDQEIDTGLHTTTPDAPEVQHYLAQMAEAGMQYAIIEATSHGLAQNRADACEFDVAAVTNITHDHLDYHGTFAEYRAAKARLFESLRTSYRKADIPKVSVLNADDSSYDLLESYPAERCYSYGIERPSDIHAQGIQFSESGTRFRVVTPNGEFEVLTPLPGLFSVYNVMAAVAVGFSQGISPEAMQRGVAAMKGVIGRMERVALGQSFDVIIDFAHTPTALEQALQTVRGMTRGRVIVVFGCAGLRDRTKRPIMGEIAGRLANRVILTAEDPRTEDVNDIMAQIAAGCRQAGRREGIDYWGIADRTEAIAAAVNMAQAGDLVIVTGKGHERSMCFGSIEYPWSDHEAVRSALRKSLGSQ